MSRLALTQSEARATDGAMCWKPKHNGPLIYGPGCSLPLDHWRQGIPCRFDVTIKPTPMTRGRFMRITAISGLPGVALGVIAALTALHR